MKTLYLTDRETWRTWLEANHTTETELWLVYYKAHTGQPSIPYEDSVEEALCFGWIDSLIKKLDEDRYARKFTPRRNGSNWSDSNLRRVRKMIEAERMTDAGMAVIEFDLDTKPASASKTVSRPEPTLSSHLLTQLKSNPEAWANFDRLPPSHKRNYIGWIMSAKKEETQLKRLQEAMDLLAQGKRLGLK